MEKHPFESAFLYGMHDADRHDLCGRDLMTKAGKKGWVVFSTRASFGPSPEIQGVVDDGFSIIVRLNNGPAPDGTIPPHDDLAYDKFAEDCANYVRQNPLAHIWIVGNEMNHPQERPGYIEHVSDGEQIEPHMYAKCFAKCRTAIRSQDGHQQDLVLVGAVAPWNSQTVYGDPPKSDYIEYFKDTLAEIKARGGCDGITLHTYTHGASPELITSDPPENGDSSIRRRDFRTYIDFMEAIPSDMRDLPVYITETDQVEAWKNELGSTWVQRAYDEIDRWNSQPGHQPIRALVLYRWLPKAGDIWQIKGKTEVIEDFESAMASRDDGHRWHPD